uniref:P/Homo B domain-containing protein n=1 Tax=candidate division WOR-3 bacterium TaxID=2052148 RepID=A0A7C4GHG3_UNCW3
MHRRGLAIMVPAMLAIALMGTIGCDANHAPVLGAITVSADTCVPGGTAVLRISATDADGDLVTFTWETTAGTLSQTTGDTVIWTAPSVSGPATFTVVGSDGRGGADSASKVLNVRAWLRGNADEFTDDSTYVPNPGTVSVELDLTGIVPVGAFVDSVRASAYFDPDTLDGMFFSVWVIAPSGKQQLVWDHVSGDLELDDVLVDHLANEPASGKWYLKVTRDAAGEDAYIEEFALDLYYRY